MNTCFRLCIMMALNLSVLGCGLVFNRFVDSSPPCAKEGEDLPEFCKQVPSDPMAKFLATKFALMAWFSELVYYRDENRFGADDEGLCERIASEHLEYGMPENWERWRPLGDATQNIDSDLSCFSKHGLFYETFVYKIGEQKSQIVQAVISFRGTDGVSDVPASLATTFGFDPNQYKVARGQLRGVIDALKTESNNDKLPIFVTGHSLGGGLAQQAGYRFQEVDEVYTFNTSPVTNWTWLQRNNLIEKPYPTMYRVFHGGEVLEKFRFVATGASSPQYGRYDIGVQFEPRSNVEGHAMKILACGLAEIYAESDLEPVEENHFLSSDFFKVKVDSKDDQNFEVNDDYKEVCNLG